MTDTVVVVGDEETEPAAELVPPEPTESAGEIADAVADAMIAGANVGAASVPVEAAERSSADQRIDGLVTEVAKLTATVAALVPTVQRAADTANDAQSAAASAVAVAVEDDAESVDDDHDTITPDRRHPWFRRFSEWRA